MACNPLNYQVSKPVTPGSISGVSKLCPGETATFSVLAVPRTQSYMWTVPANVQILSGQGSNVIVVSVSNGYSGGSISVTASNVCGISPSRTKQITVNTPPTPGVISGVSTGLCNLQGVVYGVPQISSASNYTWTISNGGVINTGQGTHSITVNYGQFSNSTMTVSASNSCGTSGLRYLALRGTPPQPAPISGPLSVCINTSGNYEVSTVTSAINYTWSSSSAGIVQAQGSKLTSVLWNTSATNQAVTLMASNACGNSPVRVLSGIAVSNCSKSQPGTEILDLQAYPNPASTQVTLRINSSVGGEHRLKLYDISGRIVWNQAIGLVSGDNTIELDLSGHSSGMYVCTIENGHERRFVRIVVEQDQ